MADSMTTNNEHTIPAGWKLVPVEPTDDQLALGQEAGLAASAHRHPVEECAEAGAVYTAMLAAAPEVPALAAAPGARQQQDAQPLTLRNAPVGTTAPAIMGGHWYRTEHGWKWNGPGGSGGTFPGVGGDWNGELIPPTAAVDAPPVADEREALEARGGRGVPLPIIEALNTATGSNEWQGAASPRDLLAPACTAIAALAAPQTARAVSQTLQEKVDDQ